MKENKSKRAKSKTNLKQGTYMTNVTFAGWPSGRRDYYKARLERGEFFHETKLYCENKEGDCLGTSTSVFIEGILGENKLLGERYFNDRDAEKLNIFEHLRKMKFEITLDLQGDYIIKSEGKVRKAMCVKTGECLAKDTNKERIKRKLKSEGKSLVVPKLSKIRPDYTDEFTMQKVEFLIDFFKRNSIKYPT